MSRFSRDNISGINYSDTNIIVIIFLLPGQIVQWVLYITGGFASCIGMGTTAISVTGTDTISSVMHSNWVSFTGIWDTDGTRTNQTSSVIYVNGSGGFISFTAGWTTSTNTLRLTVANDSSYGSGAKLGITAIAYP